ncbi:MAG TPA: CHAT domain-containing protein [Pyrinomonadaceae bacterium]|nr:CHAT domain-containing protein [Pyrinomonadaceae bacterium]
MTDSLDLDLAILNTDFKRPSPASKKAASTKKAAGSAKTSAIIYARCESDVAFSSLPPGPELKALLEYKDLINRVLLENGERPLKTDLARFGHDLFNYIIRGDVRRLYDRLPLDKRVRIHIMTNRPDLQSLPWEFLQDPSRPPGPWRERSVVRVVPTIGNPKPVPFKLTGGGTKLRILFVYADPQNQTFVSWPSVRASIERVFSARLPTNDYELKVIRGTPAELVDAFQGNNERYDIFQFSGHGEVDAGGEGRILLLNENNLQSSPLSAGNLANLLNGRGIKLAVISACSTAAGNAADPFNVVAEALVASGIPAVIANLLPVPDTSVAAFVGAMYTQLLNTGDIDLAVNDARIKLSIELDVSPDATLEWGIPTLYRHIAGSKVFDPLQAAAAQPSPIPHT